MRTVAIVQARMGSTRLPGKILKPILGRSMLEHLLERLERASAVDAFVVATTVSAADDPLERLLSTRADVGLFRGSEEDVLSRYHGAARQAGADVVVRITADCPLIDPAVVDACVRLFQERQHEADYVSNCHRRTFPRGLDTEVFSFSALDIAHREATAQPDREHVTPYIWRHPGRFRLLDHVGPEDHSSLRWTVDTPEDFELVTRIYQGLYPSRPDFAYADILALLRDHPEWCLLNRHVEQKQYGK